MLSWINRIRISKKIESIGDPNTIVDYVNRLEAERDALKEQLETMGSHLADAKAEIQYYQSVLRGGGYA